MNVLIYRLGSLGDFIVTIPALRLIIEKHKNDRIVLLTNSKYGGKVVIAEELFPKGIYYDDVIYYPLKLRNIIELMKLIIKLRKMRIDILYNLNPFDTRKQNTLKYLFFKLAGIRKIYGLHWMKANKPVIDSDGLYEKFGQAVLRNIGFDATISNINCRYCLGEENVVPNLGIEGKYFVFSAGSKAKIKMWDISNWQKLFNYLNQYSGEFTAVAIGAEEEYGINQKIIDKWLGKSINLSGKLSFKEIASLLKGAFFYIGIDSGLMHLAASVGTKVFSIFSSQDIPGLWFPIGDHSIFYTDIECKGCRLNECKIGNNICINHISPELVVKHLIRYLEYKDYSAGVVYVERNIIQKV